MNTQASRPHPPWTDRGRGFICHGQVQEDMRDIERLVLDMGLHSATQLVTYTDRPSAELPLIRTHQPDH